MSKIYLETFNNAPIERVFDLARIEIHKLSTKGTNEEAVAVRTSGLINLNESVTWRAKHFGIYQKLTVVINQFERPNLFADRMVTGVFASIQHVHRFEKTANGTIMRDRFEFTAPLGFLSRLAENLFLKVYMTKLLLTRNREIKLVAEGEEWKELIIVEQS